MPSTTQQSRPIAGLGEEQERASDTNAAKGVMVVNSSAGARQVAKTPVEESESGDEVLVVFVPAGNQALGPSLSPPVPDDHEESSYLMSLGDKVSNERNKGSGKDTEAEQFYYAERPEVVQSVSLRWAR